MNNQAEQRLNALHLNNEGVQYFESSQFEEAGHCFGEALSQLTQASHCDAPHTSQDTLPESDTYFYWSDNPTKPLHLSPSTCSTNIFLCQRALYIESGDDSCMITAPPSPSSLLDESAAVVYNLGLSFHMMGLDYITNTNKQKLLRKAASFYNIAVNIRKQQQMGKKEKPSSIDLAILNNMGQIYHEAFDYSTSRKCFEMLSHNLMWFTRNGQLECIAQSDRKGFMLNVMMKFPDIAAAA
mmetsp:Transcript_20550/g.29708  ORF Transcript_20550/g.29708 Transcript_20550/m.29708 type:complete len:240 (+) Transcript_20550:42-761(+)|eukprot:CAMPEP_0202454828 /NCGR_PEP_ID=MMETSP1360-20130828/12469_1 /ASSEMBLY_ACC=CAM_ASM_000848 /TAXON_ID=515479 /ORGANISM="Licmophora paradoxa, Strain CCMP2313" /LENGTH=239 /DNA_ID=CAMNT_0049074239 /DNA_START=22 /DNA_END=741 /DNA_ORIENTATION=+